MRLAVEGLLRVDIKTMYGNDVGDAPPGSKDFTYVVAITNVIICNGTHVYPYICLQETYGERLEKKIPFRVLLLGMKIRSKQRRRRQQQGLLYSTTLLLQATLTTLDYIVHPIHVRYATAVIVASLHHHSSVQKKTLFSDLSVLCRFVKDNKTSCVDCSHYSVSVRSSRTRHSPIPQSDSSIDFLPLSSLST
jgi:hypothetical protein